MNSSGINNKRTCAIERESENSNICQYQVVECKMEPLPKGFQIYR